MSASLLGLTFVLMGQIQGPAYNPTPPNTGEGTQYGLQAVNAAPNSTHAFNTGDPLYPYDAFEPWVHGHWQEIPAYGGYHWYRPYNYKHVVSQSQVSAGWGMAPSMPYSQQFFAKYREQAQFESKLRNATLQAQGRPRSGVSRMKEQLARIESPKPRSLVAPRRSRVIPSNHRTHQTPHKLVSPAIEPAQRRTGPALPE